MRGVAAIGVLVALTLVAGDASAGRRRFAWAWDTEVMPERGVELEWWLWERTSDEQRVAALLTEPVVGLTDNLELALPFDVAWRPASGTQLVDAGVDLRLRLASADPARAGRVVPLIRVGARRLFLTNSARVEADLVLALDLLPRLHVVLDAGAVKITRVDDAYVTVAGGASFTVTDDLQLGVEAYGEKSIDHGEANERAFVSVGPCVSFTWGRFWLSASLPISITSDGPGTLPRLIWATAF